MWGGSGRRRRWSCSTGRHGGGRRGFATAHATPELGESLARPPTAHVEAARPPIYAEAVTREAEELFRVAAALPQTERAALVVRLLDSIAGANDVVASHADESKVRLAAVREGGVEILDDDDAWRLFSG